MVDKEYVVVDYGQVVYRGLNEAEAQDAWDRAQFPDCHVNEFDTKRVSLERVYVDVAYTPSGDAAEDSQAKVVHFEGRVNEAELEWFLVRNGLRRS